MNDNLAAAPAVAPRRAERTRLEVAPADARTNDFSKSSRFVLALIVLLFVALRLSKLTAYGLFSDEVFSAETVHRSWHDMQRAVVNDVVHPPLFYYLLKAWIIAGDSLLWMKLFPVLFAVLAIIPFVLLCRELKLRAATINLALFLIAVNEYLINYAQELRMYSLLLLLVTASMWLFAKLVNASGRAVNLQLAMLATNLLLVYTHYYGWLIVGGELLFLIFKRRDRLASFGLSVAALAAGFSFWAAAVIEAAYDKGGLGPNLKWNTRPTMTDFFQHYVTLDGPVYNSWRAYATVFSTVIFITPVLYWAWRCLMRPGSANESDAAESNVLFWLALLAFLPSVIAFAASYGLKQSVWGSRFLIVVAPAYLLLIAIAATRLRPRRLRFIVVMFMVAWAATSGALQLTHRDKINWQPLVERMIEQQANQSGPVHVYTRQGVVGTTVQYYLDRANEQRLQIRYVDDYGDIDEAQFWVAFIRYRHDTGPSPLDLLAARGDQPGKAIEADAPGHKVIFIPVRRGEGNR